MIRIIYLILVVVFGLLLFITSEENEEDCRDAEPGMSYNVVKLDEPYEVDSLIAAWISTRPEVLRP